MAVAVAPVRARGPVPTTRGQCHDHVSGAETVGVHSRKARSEKLSSAALPPKTMSLDPTAAAQW
jgi:hypothetical protein